MDKNQVIGIVLIAVMFVGYMIYTQPTEEQLATAQYTRDSLALVEQQRVIAQQKATTNNQTTNNSVTHEPISLSDTSAMNLLTRKYGTFAEAAIGEDKLVSFENDLLEMKISLKGGNIHSVTLKNFQTYDSLPLKMFEDQKNRFEYSFFAENKAVNTGELYFTPQFVGEKVSIYDSKDSISFRLNAGEGKYIEYTYGLEPGSYKVKYNVRFVGLDRLLSDNMNTLDLHWNMHSPGHEHGADWENDNTALYYKYYQDEVDYLSPRGDNEDDVLATRVEWIGFKQQFFSAILVADEYFVSGKVAQKRFEEGDYLKQFTADLIVPYGGIDAPDHIGFTWYFGPNKYSELESHERGFERMIDLGSLWIDTWVNKLAIIPLFNFLGLYISNYGLLIFVLTIIIKFVLFPLTYKSYLSTAKMRVLKPQIDEINAKIPKDKAMERQQATMALYKKAGVNPAGGCLPMLLQFPILIAMFRFFPASIELRQKAFLWAEDLSSYDSIYSLPFEIPFYGDHVSLFTLLMAGSIVLTTIVSSSQMESTNAAMPGMKMMMYSMPIFMLFWFNNYSSGLSYYYFISNLITFVQTIAIRRMVNDEEILKKIKSNKKKPVKKSKFQSRLEDMAKQRGVQTPKKRK